MVFIPTCLLVKYGWHTPHIRITKRINRPSRSASASFEEKNKEEKKRRKKNACILALELLSKKNGSPGTKQGLPRIMNELTKAFGKLKQGDYGGALKQVQQQVKKVALDMTDLEVVVEEATNLEPWGPHGKLLARIAKEAGQSEENFREVMGVLVDRISCAWKKPKHWRMAYKSLLVLDYIIKNGPEQVVGELTDDESMDIFHDLEKFVFVGEDLRDYGINVRKRAQDIAALLNDPEVCHNRFFFFFFFFSN